MMTLNATQRKRLDKLLDIVLDQRDAAGTAEALPRIAI
jgi:hypothetical protein